MSIRSKQKSSPLLTFCSWVILRASLFSFENRSPAGKLEIRRPNSLADIPRHFGNVKGVGVFFLDNIQHFFQIAPPAGYVEFVHRPAHPLTPKDSNRLARASQTIGYLFSGGSSENSQDDDTFILWITVLTTVIQIRSSKMAREKATTLLPCTVTIVRTVPIETSPMRATKIKKPIRSVLTSIKATLNKRQVL